MRIVLGSMLDRGGWPGPLSDGVGGTRAAVLDELWVGIDGFVDVLEVRTGYATLDPPGHGERTADLARRLLSTKDDDAPWQRSLHADPLATARALLRTRDALLAAGVDDDTPATRLPPRLARVLAATRGALPGALERARSLVTALDDGWSPRIEAVDVVDDPPSLPAPLRALLAALEKAGTRVGRFQPRGADDLDAGADNDVARARAVLCGEHRGEGPALRGDGSLVLLHGDNVDDVAAEAACFLATREGGVIVGRDRDGGLVLDEALARAHAPTTGVRGDAGSDALLSLLPLVVAVGQEPIDPERLFELCALPLSPIPRGVALRVRSALLQRPSARADDVLAAVDVGLRALADRLAEDPSAGPAVAAQRVGELRDRLLRLVPAWGGAAPTTQTTWTSAALRERLLLLLSFLQGRKRREHDVFDDKTPYQAAIRQTSVALRLLELLDTPTLTAPQLLRLLLLSTDSVRPPAPHPAEAGFFCVDDPGAVLGPCNTLVWWGFSQQSGRLRHSRVIFADEQRALVDAGFSPPRPDDVARAHALHQRRPFFAAVERLVLCCPRRGTDGREHHPHPLWDELLARLPEAQRTAASRAVVRPEEGLPELVPRRPVTPAPPPTPRRDHRFAPGAIPPREVASPSKEEQLLGCPLRYVLHERGAVARGMSLKRGAQLEGEVVHGVLARVLRAPLSTPEAAAAAARACFDDVVRGTAGAWLLPRREQLLLRVRERAARAAAALAAFLRDNQLTVRSVEVTVRKELTSRVDGADAVPMTRILEGTPDLVAERDDLVVVIDHKTGNDDARRAALAVGGAVQLIDYAALVGERGRPPPAIAYFQLRSCRVLTTSTDLRGAEHVPGPSLREAWPRLERARLHAFRELRDGIATARGVDVPSPQRHPVVDNDVLRVPAPCGFCAADAVCGRAFTGWSPPQARSPSSSSAPPATTTAGVERV